MIRNHQDALYVYCALKEKIKSFGDTYLWFRSWKGLQKYVVGKSQRQENDKQFKDKLIYKYKQYFVSNWPSVMQFLENCVKVICIDEKENELIKGTDKRIYLWRYYWAEKDIAENLGEVMNTEQEFDKCSFCENCKCGICRECLEEKRQRLGVESDELSDQEEKKEDDMGESLHSQKHGQAWSKSRQKSLEDMEWSDNEDFVGCPKHIPTSTALKMEGKKNKKSNVVDSSNSDLRSDDDSDLNFERKNCVVDDDDDDDGGDRGRDGILRFADEDIPHNCEKELRKRQAQHDQDTFGDDEDQKAAARNIRNNPFTLIIGRGGCGKTTVVCETLKQFCSASIILAAPTGKAASNLRKKCGKNMTAKTLHQIIYTKGLADASDKEWEFCDAEILVVDECSMVSVVDFSRVLNALKEGANLKKVILMGDYRQLPSIDSGNLLQDLYEHFKGRDDVCIELKTNHRAESKHIVNCAIKISNQEMPDLDAAEFHLIDPNRGVYLLY